MPFWVYMLRCADQSYYVGHTDDLKKRAAEHERGEFGGYTETRRPVHVVFTQSEWSTARKCTVVVQQGTTTLKTLRATRWLIGSKMFNLTLPKTLTTGGQLRVRVRATSSAGSDQKTIDLTLK